MDFPKINFDSEKFKKVLSDEIKNHKLKNKNITKVYELKSNLKKDYKKYFLIEENAKNTLIELSKKHKYKNFWIDLKESNTGNTLKRYIYENPGFIEYDLTNNENKFIGSLKYKSLNGETASILDDFLNYTFDFLKIPYDPHVTIEILDSRDEYMTAGSYDTNNYIIKVLGGKRNIADILRSIAHELVHHKQNINGEIKEQLSKTGIPTIGGKIEDDANAIAGQIVKSFAKIGYNDLIYNLYY